MQPSSLYSLVVAWVLQLTHRRLRRPRIVVLEGLRVQLCPHVFNPKASRTTRFFMQHMQIPTGSSVLELGTGSGAIAAAAAQRSNEVCATDISPHAARCARATMRLNHLQTRVEILLGNLFAPVKGRRFDVILFNAPYLERKATTLEALSWCAGPKCELISRFLAKAREYLQPGGSIQILLSSAAPVKRVVALIRRHHYRINVISSGRILGLLEQIYLLRLD